MKPWPRTRPIVYVAGAHGVGKTTLCTQLADAVMGHVISTSQMYRAFHNRVPEAYFPDMDRPVASVLYGIQEALHRETTSMFIDGHLVLFRDEGFFDVPLEFFRNLPISHIILLTDEINEICARLSCRDGSAARIDLVAENQHSELVIAKEIETKLGIRVDTFHVGQFGTSLATSILYRLRECLPNLYATA